MYRYHMNCYSILVIILILLVSGFIFWCNQPPISSEYFMDNKKQNKNKKICILLTSHITKNNRDMYLIRVKRWLSKTPFDIYLVDSGNHGLHITHPRFHPFLFDQTRESYHSIHQGNSTMLEKMSLLKSLDYFHLEKKYDYIYKITGKYFVPNWKMLTQIPSNTQLVIQYRHGESTQNTELLAIKSDIALSFFNNIPEDKGFEDYVYTVLPKYQTYRLGVINLDEWTQRGDGIILKYL